MDDLTSEFLVETNESLEELDLDIVRLEQDPSDLEIIRSIFRVMHTIKGTCGFLGLPRLERVAHAAENIMDQLREEKFQVTPEMTSLILEAIDRIKEIIAELEEHGAEPDGDDSSLINRLNSCAETGSIDGSAAAGGGSGADVSVAADDVDAAAAVALAAPMGDDAMALGGITPDLDGEIDFAPVMASYADEEGDGAVAEESEGGLADVAVPALAESADEDAIAAGVAEAAVSQGLDAADAIAGGASKDGGDKGANAGKGKAAAAGGGQSIRVGLTVLENLMQMVGELVLTRNQLLQMMRSTEGSGDSGNQFQGPLQRLSIITSELQEGVMQTRMQPIGNAWAKFPRMIRDLSLELDKKIELKMVGAETDLDRQMLEAIKDPLTHMVRNSADHGIERPADRKASGKVDTGTVTLSAYHEGGHIIIKISDDGRGLNLDRIKEKAIENGLATAEVIETMSDKEIYQFIYKPGFSTADAVTAVSGRGVGMDVVVSNIERIGGTVEVNSFPGKGSEFLIELPLTLAIMSVLIVRSGKEKFAIPQIRVSEIVRANNNRKHAQPDSDTAESKEASNNSEYCIETLNGAPVLRLRGRLLPLISLARTLEFDSESFLKAQERIAAAEIAENEVDESDENGKKIASTGKGSNAPADNDNAIVSGLEPFIVVCEVGSMNFGILVDQVFHTEEIVVKPAAPLIKHLDVYSGCTILGDGSVIMILDPNGIIKASGVSGLREVAAEEDDEAKHTAADSQSSLLMFRAWGNSPRTIPLELVSRLEEIDAASIEWSGDQRVVQYRDGLMRLTMIDPSVEMPREGTVEVIVFSDEDRVMGIVVEEVLDIVRCEMDIKSQTGENGILGSMVIDKQTTDLVDVSYFFEKVFGSWLRKEQGVIEDKTEGGKKQKHILLVDDSPFFRKFMQPVLVIAGYKVTPAEDAYEAISLLESKPDGYDVVVTDIDMPEMTGIEFMQRCRKDERLAQLPFIALTSHTEESLGGDAKEMGFDSFVAKSDRDRLVSVIGELIVRKKKEAA